MTTRLLPHSPADIVRWLLISKGLGTDPADGDAWPVYVSNEPSSPDNCLTIYDTLGKDYGRLQATGERVEHFGFQIRLRSTTHPVGWEKARQLAVSMDEDCYRDSVTVGDSTYCVHSLTRTSSILPLGKDTPQTKRSLFTLNGTVYLVQTEATMSASMFPDAWFPARYFAARYFQR